MGIDGKVALVTGAGRGIGRAIALRLAKDGATVVVNDIQREAADRVVTEIQDMNREASAVIADVTDQDAVYRMVDGIAGNLGSLDIMVANAGLAIVKPLVDITPDDLLRLFQVNLFGVLYCIQAASIQMTNRGRGGKIILAGSAAGRQGSKYFAGYAATKFGVIGLTQAAARELAPAGITVNAYCPGIVDTDMWGMVDEDIGRYRGLGRKGAAFDSYVKAIPLGRAETPEDVANFVSYLAGPGSDYMTGQAVMIDGGLVMQ